MSEEIKTFGKYALVYGGLALAITTIAVYSVCGIVRMRWNSGELEGKINEIDVMSGKKNTGKRV